VGQFRAFSRSDKLGNGLTNGASLNAEAQRTEAVEAAASALEQLADSEGALGYYWDDLTKEYVVVVARTGESTFTAADASSLAADVRIESRDISRWTVDEIRSALIALRPSMKGLGYGFYFDAESGKVVLQSEAPLTAFDSVMKQFPGKIDFHPGTFKLTGWQDDAQPDDGGAWLQSDSGGLCTASFTAKNANGNKRMVTAGHCYAHDTVTNFGTVVRTSGAWPDYDLEIIKGETYEGAIYDSPSTTRPVVTASNPGIGQNYCTSARTTGFVCTWVVRSLNVTICYPSGYPGCAHGLAGFLPPTDQGTQYLLGGDSGSPLWFKYTDGSAGIRGVASGTFFDIATGRVYSYATMYQYVVSELGVSAVLLPRP
jgi:hypothetical protein